ncbi:MAG: sugar ABC transporter ATP-binding protein [Lachnospiraceae bacterium]
MSKYIVELKNITKRFPGVVALRNMSIQIKPGEVHGLIGENGAGKSTLIKVLTGVHGADEGEILVDGERQNFKNPNDSRAAGIACVYQELNIVKLLSVTDNVFMGQPIKKSSGILDYKTMHERTRATMESLGQDIDPKKESGKLGMGIQQMIEIARAVQLNARMIIMDEPTSSLGEKEVEQLMATIRKLKERNIAILFVSHKLEELFEICDRVTVMRDGEHITTDEISDMDNDKLIQAMVGRTLDNLFPKLEAPKGEVALEVKGLNSLGVLHNVSFKAHYGQILGFAGLVGAGRTETMRAIFGADSKNGGTVLIDGTQANIKSPQDAIQHKIAFLTEDRKGQGLVLSQSVRNNLIMSSLSNFIGKAFFDNKKINTVCEEQMQQLRIKAPDKDTPVNQLSGGNQQKVVVGKWVNTNAKIYIFDEPTRGIDVGAKIEVYNVMNQLVSEGKCVIMISSELPEILGMSDQVIVMREGRITGKIERDTEHFNQESIMKAAWGGKIG